MLDNDLRRLERRAAETASPDDQAAYLRARLNLGQLDATRLKLAAHLGHRAASLAVGEGPRPTKTWRSLREWAEKLSSFGSEVAFRGGLADGEQWLDVVRGLLSNVVFRRTLVETV